MNPNPKLIALAAALTLLAAPGFAIPTKPFAPIPTPFTALAAPANPAHFTFVVAGDNRSTGHGYPMPLCFAQICKEIGWVHPAFTLWSGDCIEGYGDTPAEANAEYDTFLAGAALTGVPLFNSPGNHEFSLDKTLLPVYLKRMGSLYGSFDYGNSHFIALNTSPVMPDGSVGSAVIDDTQWAWLESDLKANLKAGNIFVFLHHYLFGPVDPDDPTIKSGFAREEDRDRLHALMVKYGVRAVFAGHNHIYYHMIKDGVAYYISGGAGAPLDATPENGGYLHYVTVTVDGSKIETDVLQPWHLDVQYPDGDGKGSPTGRAWATNTNRAAISAARILFHVATPQAGQTLQVTAGVAYKSKMKPGIAKIVSVTPQANGQDEVVVEALLPMDRTMEITVAPK